MSNPDSWEEFAVGMFTGALGVPMVKMRQSKSGGKKLDVNIEGGIIGGYKDYNEERVRTQNIVDYLNNNILNSENFKNRWKHVVESNTLDELMQMDLEDNNLKKYKDHEFAKLIKDVAYYHTAGRVSDLKEAINTLGNTELSDEELTSLAKETSIQDANNKDTGMYYNDDGTIFTPQQIKDKINKNKNQALETIDKYINSYKQLDYRTGQSLTDEQLSTLTILDSQIDNWTIRSNDLYKEIQPKIQDAVTIADQVEKHLEDLKSEENVLVEGTAKNYMTISKNLNNLKELRGILDLLAEGNAGIARALIPNDIKIANELLDNIQKIAEFTNSSTLNSTALHTLSESVHDFIEINTTIKDYTEQLGKYIKNPELLIDNIAKKSENLQNGLKKITVRNIKKELKNITSREELNDVINKYNDEYPEQLNKALTEAGNQGNSIVNKYNGLTIEYNTLQKLINNKRGGKISDSVLDLSLDVLDSVYKKVNNVKELRSLKSYRDIIDSLKNLQDRAEVYDVITSALDGMLLSRISKGDEGIVSISKNKKVRKIDRAAKKAFSNNSKASKGGTNPQTPINKKKSEAPIKKKITKEQQDLDIIIKKAKPGEDVTIEIENKKNFAEGEPEPFLTETVTATVNLPTDIKETNDVVDLQDTPLKDGDKIVTPFAVSEYITETLKDDNEEANKLEVSEKFPVAHIIDVINKANGFEYLNTNIKKGDKIEFIIYRDIYHKNENGDDITNKPVIFLAARNKAGNLVPLTMLSNNTETLKQNGYERLVADIYSEYKDNNDPIFVSSKSTTVHTPYYGFNKYIDHEKELKNIYGYKDIPTFGIVIGGELITSPNESAGTLPVNMPTTGKAGQIYMLMPRMDGTYSTVGIRMKRLKTSDAKDTLFFRTNPNMVSEVIKDLKRASLPTTNLEQEIVRGLLKIADATNGNDRDINNLVAGIHILTDYLFLDGISFNYFINPKTDVMTLHIDTKNDQGVFIDKYVTLFDKDGNKIDESVIVSSILKILQGPDFSPFFNISKKSLNNREVSKRLVDAGAITSNIETFRQVNSFFGIGKIENTIIEKPKVTQDIKTSLTDIKSEKLDFSIIENESRKDTVRDQEAIDKYLPIIKGLIAETFPELKEYLNTFNNEENVALATTFLGKSIITVDYLIKNNYMHSKYFNYSNVENKVALKIINKINPELNTEIDSSAAGNGFTGAVPLIINPELDVTMGSPTSFLYSIIKRKLDVIRDLSIKNKSNPTKLPFIDEKVYKEQEQKLILERQKIEGTKNAAEAAKATGKTKAKRRSLKSKKGIAKTIKKDVKPTKRPEISKPAITEVVPKDSKLTKSAAGIKVGITRIINLNNQLQKLNKGLIDILNVIKDDPTVLDVLGNNMNGEALHDLNLEGVTGIYIAEATARTILNTYLKQITGIKISKDELSTYSTADLVQLLTCK